MPSSRYDGNNGAFFIPAAGVLLLVIVSDDGGWEHASVTVRQRDKDGRTHEPSRTPTWAEMDQVKRLFWADDETVVQYHVPRSDHVNVHDYCLHLWKQVGVNLPLPNPAFV
jgi:hypothetical protein